MEWTVLVYLNADNDLEQFGILNVNQMEMVGSTSRIKIVVQIDRAPLHDSTNGDWTGTRRYLITRDSNSSVIHSTLLQDLGELDMGDPATLNEFIQWGKANYPANRYALVVWNHGSGWKSAGATLQSVSFDDTNGTEIRTSQLPAALATDPKLDLVAFDASLMQMTEILYQMRDSAGVIVGSEESPPGEGYPYNTILGHLAANPTMTAETLGTTIVNDYVNTYSGKIAVTQSAIRGDQLVNVAAAASNLADALAPHAVADAGTLATARNATQNYKSAQYKDLVHYSQLVKQGLADPQVDSAADAVSAAVNAAIIRQAHTGSSVANSHGLSIWIPSPAEYDSWSGTYATLYFGQDYNWDAWLAAQGS